MHIREKKEKEASDQLRETIGGNRGVMVNNRQTNRLNTRRNKDIQDSLDDDDSME
jgi:hypothetical protein